MQPFHSLSSHGDVAMNEHAKHLLYKIHCGRGAIARDCDGNTRPLSECDVNDVRFISDQWRIQNKFVHPIQIVRGKEFVLIEKLDRVEKTQFEFFRASPVCKNCYGRYTIGGLYQIVAKYETDDATYWAYGDTVADARAFLGIALYDKYQDAIHAIACKNKIASQIKSK